MLKEKRKGREREREIYIETDREAKGRLEGWDRKNCKEIRKTRKEERKTGEKIKTNEKKKEKKQE